MKILFLSKAAPDYQADMLFHGLRTLYGTDVVDAERRYFMYKGADTQSLYGRGFTLYGLLDEGQVDRDDIPAKIASRYYDLIIYGSIQRCYAYVPEVRAAYPPERIVFVDGEDQPLYLRDYAKAGHYFKRELHSPQPGLTPIQFAIPAEKIVTDAPKSGFMAPLDPMNLHTYIYNDEPTYYASYRSAMFGKTMKKAGWDCLRHYEIMSQLCIPYFENLEHCPPTIMQNLPKQELLLAKTVLDYDGFNYFQTNSGRDLYQMLLEKITQTLRDKLTTTALANYLLSHVARA